MRRANLAAAVIAIFALAITMIRLAHIDDLGAAAFVGATFLFNALPILMACVTALCARSRIFAPVMLLFTITWSLYEAHAVYESFADSDAQSGLVFVSLPGIGIAALLATAVVARILSKLGGRTGRA